MLQSETTSDGTEMIAETATRLRLPKAPQTETGPVKAWEEPIILRTYLPAQPDRNPLFLEKRVYQGSSGRLYPLPVIDRIDTEAKDVSWNGVHLENEYVRFMVLPEIGGRIHVGLDKLNMYDFFYRQNVIKPALVGLAGPWISGGVELNWPQHHRPATFMPVEVFIERGMDGSVTVWCGDHDPMSHLKGMHGLCLRPGKAYLELRVRLYNRTQDTHTFLWWANVATRVHEKYQSFFPKDVCYVADHAKRAITEFPLSKGKYYGVDYGARRVHGVPDEEKPSNFVPDGSYPPNDLSWYANIPVPTSYMVCGSRGDFAGGYDHQRDAGLVSFANHHISPGKKQWTWGNHEFGYAWDRSLTDTDGPYIELMGGVYTDNQPDFSFLAPGETKTFSQYWYPIREIGVPDIANVNAALRVEHINDDRIIVHLQVTSERLQSSLHIRVNGKHFDSWHGDLTPEEPLHHAFAISADSELEVILEQANMLLMRYAPTEIKTADKPEVSSEPSLPEDVATSDELFLIGLHLEQYRHPTRNSEAYWREAIRRDAKDCRANHALGRWHLRRGELELAEQHLRIAIARLTERNPNPYDGEPHYNLGLTLLYSGQSEESYAAFYKSTWNAAWRGPAYHRLAEIDSCRKEWDKALEHIDRSLRADADNLNARNLKAMLLRQLGRSAEADALLDETRQLDPLDIFSRFLTDGELPTDGRQRLDLAFDLMRSGFLEEAAHVATPIPEKNDGSSAMLLYAKAHIMRQLGNGAAAAAAHRQAAASSSDYVFPDRIEEMLLLTAATRLYPEDARARFYLGNLLYDRRRHREAIALWEDAVRLDAGLATAWRNLGLGYYNELRNAERARESFAKARAVAPDDARILYEQDQLLKRCGESLEERLSALETHRDLVDLRDDLSIELASLYNSLGRPESALRLMLRRQFQPWEGGEGQVLAQFVRANLLLGQRALKEGIAHEAVRFFQYASNPPQSISEARHLLMNFSAIDYWLGMAYKEYGTADRAKVHFERAAQHRTDFQQMQVQPVSEMSYWSAMALLQLDRGEEARALFQDIYDYATELDRCTPKIDYFATSLPAMLLFEEDLEQRRKITVLFLKAQALLGLQKTDQAWRLLQQVLKMDHSHTNALDLCRSLEG